MPISVAVMSTPITALSVNEKLREIRKSKSLSLRDVEELSNSTIKAVVLGSYERGSRTLSVKRVIALANLYQIPVSELFGASTHSSTTSHPKLLLDLRLVRLRAANQEHHFNHSYCSLLEFLERVVQMRQDWNGEVVSLRESDLLTLSLLVKKTPTSAMAWISEESILLQMRK